MTGVEKSMIPVMNLIKYNKRLNALYIFVQDIQPFAVSEQKRLLPKICIYIV